LESAVYAITTIDNDDTDEFGKTATATVGYFKLFRDADHIVSSNIGDIYEDGSYPYVLIELLCYGLYCLPAEEYWYKWSKTKNKYERLKGCPKFAIDYFGYSNKTIIQKEILDNKTSKK